MAHAHEWRPRYNEGDPEIYPGTTGGTLSADVLNELKTKGVTSLKASIAADPLGGMLTGILGGNAGDKRRASLGFAATDGKAFLQLHNDNGNVVSHLGQGASGGGLLQLANPGGNAQVEAGVLAEGAGIVRTFPNGNPGAGLVGMPGTFIMGRSGKN